MRRETFTLYDSIRLLIVGVDSSESNLSPSFAAAHIDSTLSDGYRGYLLSWYRREVEFLNVTADDDELFRRLMNDLRSGRVRVREEPREYGRARGMPAPPPSVSPRSHAAPYTVAKPEPLVDSGKSLLITDCPPLFDPRRESLRVSYLLRELAGRSVELIVRSKAAPEPPVHRRLLTANETKDGASKLEWDGSDDATGQPVDRYKSPFLVELVHDQGYRDQAPTSIPPASLVHVVEMEDLMFATGRSIVLPDGGLDEHAKQGHERATGLHAIAAVLRHAAFHPDEKLCVFGHTDTVGDDVDNLQLSRDRATNVLHLLAGDVDAWASHCDQTYAVADFQRVLKWIAQTKGWPTSSGTNPAEVMPTIHAEKLKLPVDRASAHRPCLRSVHPAFTF